jgi:hypothetical protein
MSPWGLERGDIACRSCGSVLAEWLAAEGAWAPAPQELLAPGHIPVPHLGWFCDEACAIRFERRAGIRLRRDDRGRIRYY